MPMGKKGQWVSCKHLYYVFRYLCKVDYAIDKIIHAPTFNCNEVMHLLKLVGVAKLAKSDVSAWHGHIIFR